MSFSTFHPTPAEWLLISRRRHGWSQAEAAKRFRTGLTRYRLLETGEQEGAPRVRSSALTPLETCFLLRRRKGLTQAQLAKKLGVCRFLLLGMELGQFDAARLIDFWKKKASV